VTTVAGAGLPAALAQNTPIPSRGQDGSAASANTATTTSSAPPPAGQTGSTSRNLISDGGTTASTTAARRQAASSRQGSATADGAPIPPALQAVIATAVAEAMRLAGLQNAAAVVGVSPPAPNPAPAPAVANAGDPAPSRDLQLPASMFEDPTTLAMATALMASLSNKPKDDSKVQEVIEGYKSNPTDVGEYSMSPSYAAQVFLRATARLHRQFHCRLPMSPLHCITWLRPRFTVHSAHRAEPLYCPLHCRPSFGCGLTVTVWHSYGWCP
jgi:hypothetical protein